MEAAASFRISAYPTSIKISQSVTIRADAANLNDAYTSTFAGLLAYIGKVHYAVILGEQSITFTYEVWVKGKSFWPDPMYKYDKFQRILMLCLDHSTFTVRVKIRMGDGRILYPKTAPEVAAIIFSFSKTCAVSRSQLWGTQLPWTRQIERDVYAEMKMGWTAMKFIMNVAGGATPVIGSNTVIMTVTK